MGEGGVFGGGEKKKIGVGGWVVVSYRRLAISRAGVPAAWAENWSTDKENKESEERSYRAPFSSLDAYTYTYIEMSCVRRFSENGWVA